MLLGTVVWPKSDEPRWKMVMLIAGMTTSIIGIFFRYLSHRKEEAAITFATKEAEREARQG